MPNNTAEVRRMFIYPVKSMGGIEVSQAELRATGFENDRKWMLVDEKGRFISQRKYPIMSQFAVELNSDQLTIRFKNEFVNIDSDHQSTEQNVQIWGENVTARSYSEDVNGWISECLDQPVKLVRYQPNTPRIRHKSEPFEVMFSDGYPVLIVNESEIENTGLSQVNSASILRFRPNLVISCPDDEDFYRIKKITTRFTDIRIKKPCVRCTVPSINPNTGEIDEKMILRALHKNPENEPVFGLNGIVEKEGKISVGESIQLMS